MFRKFFLFLWFSAGQNNWKLRGHRDRSTRDLKPEHGRGACRSCTKHSCDLTAGKRRRLRMMVYSMSRGLQTMGTHRSLPVMSGRGRTSFNDGWSPPEWMWRCFLQKHEVTGYTVEEYISDEDGRKVVGGVNVEGCRKQGRVKSSFLAPFRQPRRRNQMRNMSEGGSYWIGGVTDLKATLGPI